MASWHESPIHQPGDTFGQGGWEHRDWQQTQPEEPRGWSLAGWYAILVICSAILLIVLLFIAGHKAAAPKAVGWTWDTVELVA